MAHPANTAAPFDGDDTGSAIVWGDPEQLATIAAMPATWFPSWARPDHAFVPERAIHGGFIFFTAHSWPVLTEWVEDRCLNEKFSRLYWLARSGCPAGQLTCARRGIATDSWVEGLGRLPPCSTCSSAAI